MLEHIGAKSIPTNIPLKTSYGNAPSGKFLESLIDCLLNHGCGRVLVCMDRLVSSALGRPCAIQDEEYAHSS